MSLACREYDHTRAFLDGTVPVEGVRLDYRVVSPPSQIFIRMLRDEEFDASEMSLSNYLISVARGDKRFVAIPIFPSRVFRHSNIWIRSDSEISEPRDLMGRRVGIPDYSMTALLFIRGMLQHQYGVLPEDIFWFRSRSEHVGAIELPRAIRIENISKDETLAGLLETGKLDAMVSMSLPVGARSGLFKRLFPRPRHTEAEYYRQTEIFPIMHTVVIRRVLYDRHPWIALNLAKAFQLAKERAEERCAESLYAMPWFGLDLEFAREVLGENVYPYGIQANLPTLEAATLFSYEQGLTHRRLELEELFAPETLNLFAHS